MLLPMLMLILGVCVAVYPFIWANDVDLRIRPRPKRDESKDAFEVLPNGNIRRLVLQPNNPMRLLGNVIDVG